MNTQPSITSKARLLLLAPYTGLKVLFENIVHEYSMIELTAYVSDTREAAGFVTSLDLSQYDIIISRGYTCDLIERACKRHVLDVGISIHECTCLFNWLITIMENMSLSVSRVLSTWQRFLKIF